MAARDAWIRNDIYRSSKLRNDFDIQNVSDSIHTKLRILNPRVTTYTWNRTEAISSPGVKMGQSS